jgi:DNA modification methylase
MDPGPPGTADQHAGILRRLDGRRYRTDRAGSSTRAGTGRATDERTVTNMLKARSTTARRRVATATSAYGSGRREAHDSSAFYRRFAPPALSDDVTLGKPGETDVIRLADARQMLEVPTGSVALVVTSPPYFAGKEYEVDLGRDGVPASYLEYLGLLRAVFAECCRVLEPGGRIAVNVANLGRRPYRSLSSDVVGILQDDLGLLLRGEVVWVKGRAATGSCAWGSFQSPANPVLRDLTERILIAGKGRFSRAGAPRERRAERRPWAATVTRDEFLEATTDVWEVPPESARRVGHPAPFPVELPQRLIELLTYRDDVVLDPFVGSGTTAVAAIRTGRHFIGYDTDPSYVATARRRVATEVADRGGRGDKTPRGGRSRSNRDPVQLAMDQGHKASDVARVLLEHCGFVDVRTGGRVRRVGMDLDLVACDAQDGRWAFLVCGTFAIGRSGLSRSDIAWRAIGQATVLHGVQPGTPLILLTTEPPPSSGPVRTSLDQVTGNGMPVHDVVALLDPAGRRRLRAYARRGAG